MIKSRKYSIHGIELKQRTIHLPLPSKEQKLRARGLRNNGVLSELIFWRHVKSGAFHGIDFHRQQCIGPFIVDFYIRSFGVVIELDGAGHIGKYEYDKRRDEFLRSMNLHVIHIPSNVVVTAPESALQYVESELIEKYGIRT